jgi:hypothetical protein
LPLENIPIMLTQYQIKSLLNHNLKNFVAVMAISILCIRHGHSQSILGESDIGTGVFGTSNADIGVRGSSMSYIGVYGTSNTYFGVYGLSNFNAGVAGYSYSNAGVYGVSNNHIGIYGLSHNSHGAYFRGDKEGGFADIVLKASSGSSAGDDGVIISDPDVVGSDIFLKANDAVVVQIDKNNNSQGNFFVWDGSGTNLFQVTHDGDVLVKGATVHGSDRNRKEEITGISYSNVLQAIKDMPIYEWQYKGQDRRHIGPMAQDFHQAFHLGDDDKTIAAIDADGVALAAIKAQQEIIEDQEKRISQHESEINFLKQEIADLKSLMISDVNLRKTK